MSHAYDVYVMGDIERDGSRHILSVHATLEGARDEAVRRGAPDHPIGYEDERGLRYWDYGACLDAETGRPVSQGWEIVAPEGAPTHIYYIEWRPLLP